METDHAQTVSHTLPSARYCPEAPCACADVSGMNFEPVPIIAQATLLTASSNCCSGSNFVCNGDVFTLLECHYQTTDRYDKGQTSPLASLEARWLAPASA